MPIRPDLKALYPPHWAELSQQVRFERAGGRSQRCHLLHGHAYHLMQRRLTYRPRLALGDFFEGPY